MSNSSHKKDSTSVFAFAWTKDVLLLLFSLALIWRVIVAKIDLKGFSFNDLLSLLLAVFSVALSVAFYFKANETSNQFYDNTYKFTKDMSELLGRIEAGFGERLRHLDEGYMTMVERFDKLPGYLGPTVSQVQSGEAEVANLNQNVANIIEGFASKAHLAEQEKKDLINSFSRANEELTEAKKALSIMKSRTEDDTNRLDIKRRLPPQSIVLRFVAERIKGRADLGSMGGHVSEDAIVEGFEEIKSNLPSRAISDMKALGLVDEAISLTKNGKSGLLDMF
jgi:hypothetical protein